MSRENQDPDNSILYHLPSAGVAASFRLLIVGDQHNEAFHSIVKFKPNWAVFSLPDEKAALEFIHQSQIRLDTIIVYKRLPNYDSWRRGPDALQLLEILRTWDITRNAHTVALLNDPCSKADNLAALAAGARLVWHTPRHEEEPLSFLKAMFNNMAYERLNRWERYSTA